MGLKVLQFPREEHNSWAPGLGGLPVVNDHPQEQDCADSLLRSAMGRFAPDAPSGSGGTAIGANQYQIALIPLQTLMNQSGSDAPVAAKLNSVLVLPLTWRDLVKHLRAEVGRSKPNQASDVVGFGAVRMKFSTMEIHRAGKRVQSTALEFKLLRYFVEHPDKVISRDELLNQVWGFDNYPCTRTVDSLVYKLRKKLEPDPANPIHFHSVHSIGYRFTP